MIQNPEKIKVLCFDVDGTLRDTDDQYAGILSRILQILFTQKIAERLARWVVMKIETPANFIMGIPDKFGLDDEIVNISNWVAQKLNVKRSHSYLLIPKVIETLELLSQNYLICAISTRPIQGTEGFIYHFGLERFIKLIISGQTVERTKPYPDPIFWACKQFQVEPDECLMIGDTTVDIKTGIAAGTQTVGVLSGFGEKEELVKTGADLILEDISHLPAVLKS